MAQLKTQCTSENDVQLRIPVEGLSAITVEKNAGNLLPMIDDGLKMNNISADFPVVVQYGRVAVGDQIGLGAFSSRGHQFNWRTPGTLVCRRAFGIHHLQSTRRPKPSAPIATVVSNIHERGTPAVETGAYIVRLVKPFSSAKSPASNCRN